VPEAWELLQAIGPKPRHLSRRPRRLKRAVSAGPLPEIARKALAQLVQLCRAHEGLRWLATQVPELPPEMQDPSQDLLNRLLLPRPLSDVTEVATVRSDQGDLSALKTAVARAKELEEEVDLRRLVRVDGLMKEAGLAKPNDVLSPARARAISGRIQWLGPDRTETLLRVMAVVRRPWRLFKRPLRRRRTAQARVRLPPMQALLVGFMAVHRMLDLAADRMAAEAVGGIEPVVAGLVRLHGSPAERRRLRRGELRGLIEDAKADQLPRRWAAWWTSFVGAWRTPPLQLQTA